MVTVTITIKPYLATYMYVRYAQSLEPESESRPSPSSSASLRKPIPIHLSHITPIYHFLYQLSVPHPSKVSWKETGNITFVLPNPAYGKNPEVYNYIGQESALTIEKEIEVEMRAELYEFLLENKFKNGIMFKRSMELFVEHYNMEGNFHVDNKNREIRDVCIKFFAGKYVPLIPFPYHSCVSVYHFVKKFHADPRFANFTFSS